MLALSVPVLAWCGSEFYVIAWRKLKHFSANMDTLVALSTGVAFVFSLFNTLFPPIFDESGIDAPCLLRICRDHHHPDFAGAVFGRESETKKPRR